MNGDLVAAFYIADHASDRAEAPLAATPANDKQNNQSSHPAHRWSKHVRLGQTGPSLLREERQDAATSSLRPTIAVHRGR
jgi:hypothetical protein